MCNSGLKGTICPLIQKFSELCLVGDGGVLLFYFFLKHGFSRSYGDYEDRLGDNVLFPLSVASTVYVRRVP